MGLESLKGSILSSINYATVKVDELTKSFSEVVQRPATAILFDALALCVMQGGIAMTNFFETYTSWVLIPELAFLPLHKCKETYMGTSQMYTNTQEIETFVNKTQDIYSGVPKDQLNPNILKIMNLDTQSIPQSGIMEYKNYLRIEAEYFQEPQRYIIDTQFIKVGFPNILKFLRAALDAMPYQIPVYYYSERTGGLSKPWRAVRDNNERFVTSHFYTLSDFSYMIDRDDNKITFNIILNSSLFDIYSLEEDNSTMITEKTDQINNLANLIGL
jgi:hypothetical protein